MRIYGILTLVSAEVLYSILTISGNCQTTDAFGNPPQREHREVFDRTGSTPQSTARTLVHDRKWGMRAKKYAIRYADEVIPHIRSESEDFKLLNSRNSFWVADVLGAIDSKLAKQTLRELYARKELTPRLVGSIGLGMHGLPPNIEEEGSFLLHTAVNYSSSVGTGYGATPHETFDGAKRVLCWHSKLAIIALGYSQNVRALDPVHAVLEDPNRNSTNAVACQALARLHFEEKSIPVLRASLESQEFYALPDVFRALVCLGDKQAIPLAIERIGKDLEGTSSAFIIDELSRVTGKFYVYDKQRWSQWWKSVENTWQIPERFLVEWDAQPNVYSKVTASALLQPYLNAAQTAHTD